MRISATAATVAALLALVPTGAVPARAADTPGITVRFPSGQVPDANALAAAISDPGVGTVIFEKGTNPFASSITVFRRKGLTLRGATGRPEDVVIESSATVAILLDEAEDVRIEGLTIRSTAANGEGVRLQAVRSSSIEGFVRDVSVRRCRVEGFVPLRGTVRANGLAVADSRLDVTRAGGVGILWEDGPNLLVTRTRFTCSATDFATGAVLVRGALVADSEGDRARHVVLTRNRISGDFATAIDLADVVDARVQRNRIEYSNSAYTGDGGRAGIVVRRQAASAQTSDFELRRNLVRGAHTAVWCLNVDAGVVASNDLRRSGRATADTRFQDTGCAIRIGLFGPNCKVRVDGNDLRSLASAPSQPAVIVTPTGTSPDGCFPEGTKNRVDAGRDIY